MRVVSVGMGVMLFAFTNSFPQVVHLYWVYGNMVSVFQSFALSYPSVKRLLNIPVVPPKKDVQASGTAGIRYAYPAESLNRRPKKKELDQVKE